MRDLPKRHPHQRLTARAVQTARPRTGTRRMADGGGLYLRVAPSGAKSWILRTVIQGRRCDLGLGSVTLVSLAEAREQAVHLRKVARAGGDPLAERRRAHRWLPTFEEATRQVHAAHAAGFRNEKHRKQWLASLAGVVAAFGAKRVDAITSADILMALGPQWLARPETSRRVLQRVRMIFEWCTAQGYCAGDNPTQGLTKVLPKYRHAPRHHAALPYHAVPAFLRTLRAAEASEASRLAFEFLILTVARTSEVLLATWSEVDLDTRTWTIPGARMKSGRAHSVPLAPRVLEILHRAKGLSDGGPYVFPRSCADKTPLEHGLADPVAPSPARPPHSARVPQHVSGLGGRTHECAARGLRSRPGPHAPGQGRSGLQPDRPVRAPPRADDDMGGLCHGTGG